MHMTMVCAGDDPASLPTSERPSSTYTPSSVYPIADSHDTNERRNYPFSKFVERPTPNKSSVIMPRQLSEKEKAAFAANPAFEKAAERESKQLLKKPDNNELLELYGLYKVGCAEDVTEYQKGPKAPGMFDLKGKAKLKAWEGIVDENLTPEQAQERYIALVEQLKTKLGFDPAKEPEVVGSS
ncbi:acyl CoA binding protein-domain-containing protein [Xylaria longipes]|nr:acyl CoA binding protein-domain-containing protein [Xylaria longipes]RYC63830.1 hypothetical protein CHU98_g2372 [Xylaria longipes]